MKVINVNKAIGYASSGVEYAQKYREELLRDLSVEDVYIFVDYIATNLCEFTDLIGIPSYKVIWIYNFLANRKTVQSSYSVEEFLESIGDAYEITARTMRYIDVILLNKAIKYKIWLVNSGKIDRIDTIVNNWLESVAHYDVNLNNVQYYQDGKLIRRVFFDSNQAISFEQFYENNEITQTHMADRILNGRTEFFRYFFEQLAIKEEDVIIIDRALDVADAIVPFFARKARLLSIIHAEHYNESLSDENNILWNNYYEYVFDNLRYFEAIIPSTKRQKEVLDEQLNGQAKIVAIPVGYAQGIIETENYNPYGLITASRLADEKHINVLIKAVAKAKETMPELIFDIYGDGQKEPLIQLINELSANEYIRLQGHHKMDGIYSRYGLYLTASTSEGFGLTLLEATRECLPIIGLDVDYGNREFVRHEKNGLLVPHTTLDEDVDKLAQAIIEFYEKGMVKLARKEAKKIAEQYTRKTIQKKWRWLLEGRV